MQLNISEIKTTNMAETKLIIEIPDGHSSKRLLAISQALEQGEKSYVDPFSKERFSLNKLRNLGIKSIRIKSDVDTILDETC